MNKTRILLAAPVMVLLAVTACHSGGKAASRASAMATNTAVAQERQAGQQILEKDGVPVNGSPAAQIAFAKSLDSQSGRVTLEQKLAIPPAKRPAFDAALLGAVEKGEFTTHDGRAMFFEATLPQLVEHYQ